jgi:hypothetical protein
VSARIYARAAAVSAAELRTKGRTAVKLSDRYQERAEFWLLEALKRLPRDGELTWGELQTDPDLRTIRRRLGPALKRAVPIDSRPSSEVPPAK